MLPRPLMPHVVGPWRVLLSVHTSGSTQVAEFTHCPTVQTSFNVPRLLKPHAVVPARVEPLVQTCGSRQVAVLPHWPPVQSC
jgi:hypothetical protein